MYKKAEEIYPVTIVMDRYEGCASGGKYLAFNLDFWDVPHDIEDADAISDEYWATTTQPVGRGNTVQEALDDLLWRVNEFLFKSHLEQEMSRIKTAAQEWHDGSELPENPDKDTIYLAIGLNGKPFLTHLWTEGLWKESVVKWQYIDIPTNTPS